MSLPSMEDSAPPPKVSVRRPGSDRWKLASTTFPDAGPMVRIRFPPAASPLQTRLGSLTRIDPTDVLPQSNTSVSTGLPHFGFGAVFRSLDLIDNTAVAVAAIGEIPGLGRALADYRPLAAVSLITPHPGLIAVQQIGQHRAVGDIGRRGRHRVDQLAPAVDANMRLHPEVPLVSLLGLMHLGIAG